MEITELQKRAAQKAAAAAVKANNGDVLLRIGTNDALELHARVAFGETYAAEKHVELLLENRVLRQKLSKALDIVVRHHESGYRCPNGGLCPVCAPNGNDKEFQEAFYPETPLPKKEYRFHPSVSFDSSGKINPPPFGEWHRDDWTPEMLDGGWRPQMLGEVGEGQILYEDGWDFLDVGQQQISSCKYHKHRRTFAPLPEDPNSIDAQIAQNPILSSIWAALNPEQKELARKSYKENWVEDGMSEDGLIAYQRMIAKFCNQ